MIHTSKHFCRCLDLFLGLWGSLHPFMAMKSSSFSLFERETKNLGRTMTPPLSSPPIPIPNSFKFPFSFSSQPTNEPLVVQNRSSFSGEDETDRNLRFSLPTDSDFLRKEQQLMTKYEMVSYRINHKLHQKYVFDLFF